MKQMKKKSLALLAALLLLLLTACGGGAKNSSPSDSNSASTSGANMDMPMEAPEPMPGWEEDEGYNGSEEAGMPANTKVILTGDLDLETKEFEDALQALDALVAELGGWYENRSVNQGGTYRSVSAVIRVPAKNFSALMARAGEVAHKTYGSENQTDISEVYYDNEARLATQRTKLERLQTLLAQAENMEDIIALESAISETELQIEYLTGSLRKYDSLVNYSTVNLSLREVYRLSTDQEVPLTFTQRLGDAFITGLQRGIDNLEDFSIAVARNWLSLLLLIVIAAAAVMVYRRRKRTRPAFPPAVQPPQKPEQRPGQAPAQKPEQKEDETDRKK